VSDGNQVRRRRECVECKERYTTYETAELLMPHIIKRDGRRSPFDEDKMRQGMRRALEKRPVSVDDLETAIANILRCIRETGEREVSTAFIGEQVMSELSRLDQVAYVRYASVYRKFEDINEFREEILRLESNQTESDA